MNSEVNIAGRLIGPGHAPYIICELSGNHNGSLPRALDLVKAAAMTGCDAIKLQTYTPDTMTLDSDFPDFLVEDGPWAGYRLYDLYKEAHTPYEWHQSLFDCASELGVTMFSTPFDETAVDLLEGLGAPAYKIASFEINDHALIARVSRTGKPLIISTGLADLSEISAALEVARAAGNEQIVLLHCVSAYPAPVNECNVSRVQDLADRFGVVSGLSDHSLGSIVSVAAVARGAAVIEKHFTLSRADGGPDAGFSLEPAEFSALVRDCRAAHASIGAPSNRRVVSEANNIAFRRSIYVVRDVAAGETLDENSIRAIRPGKGLEPRFLPELIGRRARRDLRRGEPLIWELVE